MGDHIYHSFAEIVAKTGNKETVDSSINKNAELTIPGAFRRTEQVRSCGPAAGSTAMRSRIDRTPL